MITNIYLRLLFGSWCIIIGLVSLKLYFSKHKNNKCGDLGDGVDLESVAEPGKNWTIEQK